MTRWIALVEAWATDGALAERLCLTLAHSLWQFALLALVAWSVNLAGNRLSHAARYNVCLLLLAIGLLAAPITWASLPDYTYSNAAQSVVVATDTVSMPPSNGSPVRGAAAAPPGQSAESIHDRLPKHVDAIAAAGLATEGVAVNAAGARAKLSWRSAARARASRWIVALYAGGVCLMIARLLRGMWLNHRLVRGSQSLASHPLKLAMETLAARWRLRLLPRLAVASEVAMPCVMGLVRPTIVFPLAALNSLSPGELEMILAHELAHVRRRDLWAHLLQRLAEAVLFFNPGAWYVSRRISLLREYCCDE